MRMPEYPSQEFSDLVTAAEAWEADDPWAIEALLDCEILTQTVVDPCAGRGLLAEAAAAREYNVITGDKYDWGYPIHVQDDFLTSDSYAEISDNTVLFNPPFSLAVQFVERAMQYDPRKIVCFQRFAWWESSTRKDFWDTWPPSRIYICGNRATCWRFDIQKNEKGQHINPKTGTVMHGTPTAHAWFVWERGQPRGPVLGHIYKGAR